MPPRPEPDPEIAQVRGPTLATARSADRREEPPRAALGISARLRRSARRLALRADVREALWQARRRSAPPQPRDHLRRRAPAPPLRAGRRDRGGLRAVSVLRARDEHRGPRPWGAAPRRGSRAPASRRNSRSITESASRPFPRTSSPSRANRWTSGSPGVDPGGPRTSRVRKPGRPAEAAGHVPWPWGSSA